MDPAERMALVVRNTAEVVDEKELFELLRTKDRPRAYIGFEPSGLVHLGWALVANKIRDLCDAGFEVIVFWADWHAYINDKLGGDLENIRTCARYMEDCFKALGVPEDKARFVYASEILDDIEYWGKVIKVAKVTSLQRVKRAMTVLGRSEDEAEVDSSKLLYPLLQATDIFCMDVDLAYAGMDQRRAHMLARDAAEKLKWKKPIALHTPLIPGLKGGDRMNPAAFKMSKSDPGGSINIHDDDEAVRSKMKKAFCPPEKEKEEENPVLMLCKYVIFPRMGRMDISRPEKFGGDVSFESYEELVEAYFGGKLFPLDLKNGASESLIAMLVPVREYFDRHPENYAAMRQVFDGMEKLR
ncbi:MAG: tyrosine--tRNA ligase [Candidatus Methanoplasma sp.]|jgi:tyrosyl-tRNA synthetase|nr:tyrosine--tRNA ligase [Candidatus Methanoplasma sp.]